jgi:hypothetical protein
MEVSFFVSCFSRSKILLQGSSTVLGLPLWSYVTIQGTIVLLVVRNDCLLINQNQATVDVGETPKLFNSSYYTFHVQL